MSLRARFINFLLSRLCKPLWRNMDSVADYRKMLLGIERWVYGALPRGTTISAVNAGGVSAHWLRRENSDPGRVLFYLHGGGFCTHMPKLYARFAADLGRRLNADVLLVDYRLAPEHPFPAAPDDCIAAWRWLCEQPTTGKPQRFIAGDSAGANLALVTVLQAKEMELPLPDAAWIISPAVDCDWSHDDYTYLQNDCVSFSTDTFRIIDIYFGGVDRADYRISPINGELAGLPPMLIEAGTREMFRKHPERFATDATREGSNIQTRLWKGMPHCFQTLEILPEAQRARESATEFLLSKLSA